METRVTKQMAIWLLGASALALAACGGSSEPEVHEDAPAASLEETVEDVSETVEESTEDVTDLAEDVADETSDTLEEAGETAEDLAEEAGETLEDIADTAEDAVEDVTSWEPTDKVSAEAIAAYSALTPDADAGRRVFTKCMSCHVIAEGQNRVGPSLYGIVGREAGTVEGFGYSDVNANSGVVWTEPALFVYLENPQAFLPRTTMAFPGLPRPQERADLIAYIKRESGE
ncbi:MAG: c-type cytochrome [Hyphomonadaceae bacterium]|nr:c-type cytochrome [Hyphomonadaceae bacterium]